MAKTFVVLSDNKKLLMAFYQTCLEMGCKQDIAWNTNRIEPERYKTLAFEEEGGMTLYNHPCFGNEGPRFYLPQDWDAALKAAAQEFNKPSYQGKWKVGDTLSESMLNSGVPLFSGYTSDESKWVTSSMFHDDRKIEAIEFRGGRWAGFVSGTMDIWIDLDSIPDEKQILLKKLAKASGLVIGAKDSRLNGKKYRASSWAEDGEWRSNFSDLLSYLVRGFTYHKDVPCVEVGMYGSNKTYFLPLDQFTSPTIKIGNWEAVADGNTIKFGCQSFTKAELKAYRRLLLSPMDGEITIKGVKITEKILTTLLEKISK